MTTFTNPVGLAITHTTEFAETNPLQLNPSINYYTSGQNHVIFAKINYNKTLNSRLYITYLPKYTSNYTQRSFE